MKILRAGPPWERKQECITCHSLLLLDEQDVQYLRVVTDRDRLISCEVVESFYYFACAKCSTKNRLDAAELPEHLTKAALEAFERVEHY